MINKTQISQLSFYSNRLEQKLKAEKPLKAQLIVGRSTESIAIFHRIWSLK